MTQEGYQVIIILPIKSKMAAASPPSFKVRGLQMTIIGISVNTYQ